ncbi:MAG TPA: TonB-dependent receptor plug domain-containing protein [Chitinophagaceae bacterium]|nr:TonB-dependent receptor plug domain-containing protein [Chitinophagaceae bacterium]
MKKIGAVILLSGALQYCSAQEEKTDSLKILNEVIIRSFEHNRRQQLTTASVNLIHSARGDRSNKNSFVNSFNAITGVRMEERSPGSYRINIRGSSLRSPFGVRNVKVYWNGIPVTDPGGNTYFNQFAWNNFSGLEIVKGPAGSLYGAGTGGLIWMNTMQDWNPGIGAEYIVGSYNLHNFFADARFGKTGQANQLTYAHNQTNGYRVQSKMRRDNFSWVSRAKISEKQTICASLLFSDLYYQTPGALTLAEFNSDPRSARPAAGVFPSAVEARAAIDQKNLLAGFSNEYQIGANLRNTTSLYGAFSQVKNAAIRNYERRNEPHFGGRTVFAQQTKNKQLEWQWVAGAEFQQGYFNTQVSENRNGNPDTLQTDDDIDNIVYAFFGQVDANLSENWFITAGLSLNKTNLSITRLNEYPVRKQRRSYRNELAPRLAVMKRFGETISWRLTLSKGFSPPTTAELLPSTGVISTELEAEQGWNYESTFQFYLLQRQLQLELTGYYFKLNNALVQRRDLSGADYFVNSGDTRQKAIEFKADYTWVPRGSGIINYLAVGAGYTYNHFRYGNFIKGTEDYSGKIVPSVPKQSISVVMDLLLNNGFYSNATLYTASKIYLNDVNTATAEAYQLLGLRLGWKKTFKEKYRISIYAGADNLLDQSYSLGNDINAPAGRYFNAAAARNYYAGIALQWNKTTSNNKD